MDHVRDGTTPALPSRVGLAARRRAPSELGLGDRVGPYGIARRLARNCYDGDDVHTGAYVIIELADNSDGALVDVRFARARANLELLRHPGIARILDNGVLADGRPWVASQRPPGSLLSDLLAERRLEPHEIRAFVTGTARVLADAHANQIVHGALRPHHVVLTETAPGISIAGWAWLRTPGIPAFADAGSVTVYTAPEQQEGAAIDGRADVYALGAMAYRALTGVFPDVERDLLDTRDPLAAVIESMLERDPRERASAAAVVVDLTD